MNNKHFTERVDLCLTPKQKKLVDAYAIRDDLRINEAIRRLIDFAKEQGEL